MERCLKEAVTLFYCRRMGVGIGRCDRKHLKEKNIQVTDVTGHDGSRQQKSWKRINITCIVTQQKCQQAKAGRDTQYVIDVIVAV